MYYMNNWNALMQAWKEGKVCEIDQAVFDHFLDVLPPKGMNRFVKLIGGREVCAWFLFAEGADRITAFWKENNRYYLGHTVLVSNG